MGNSILFYLKNLKKKTDYYFVFLIVKSGNNCFCLKYDNSFVELKNNLNFYFIYIKFI